MILFENEFHNHDILYIFNFEIKYLIRIQPTNSGTLFPIKSTHARTRILTTTFTAKCSCEASMEGPAIFEVLDNLSIELWVIFPNSFHKLAAPGHQIHRTVGVKWISRTKTRMVCQLHRYVGEEFPCCTFYVIFSGTVRQNRLVYYPMNHHVQNLATRL